MHVVRMVRMRTDALRGALRGALCCGPGLPVARARAGPTAAWQCLTLARLGSCHRDSGRVLLRSP